MYSAFSLYPLISFAPSCNALRIYSSSFSSDACLHLLVWFCCSFDEHGYNSFTITINYSIPSKQDDFYYIYIFHQMIHNKIVLINRNQSRNTANFSRQFCPVWNIYIRYDKIQTMEQLCCRVADLYFILHRMGWCWWTRDLILKTSWPLVCSFLHYWHSYLRLSDNVLEHRKTTPKTLTEY